MLSILFFLVIIYLATFGQGVNHEKLMRRNLTKMYGKEYADEFFEKIKDKL